MNINYIGHSSQISGVEEHRLVGGKGDGMRLLQVRNGLGLEFTVVADRAADISRLSFQGMNMSYFSPCGYVGPQYYEREGFGFLKSFYSGFLTTCGLGNIGIPTEDQDGSIGLHGTISNTPAEQVYYTEDGEEICIHALIRDAEIFKQKLLLSRTISCSKLTNTLSIHDVVRNEGSRPEPISILYHMNLGYPLLDENAVLSVSSKKVEPRDERAAEDADTWMNFRKPQANFEEQCYYHSFEGTTGIAKLSNPTICKSLEIRFDTSTLDHMVEWKMMGERDYVLGVEPGNNRLDGRGILREKNALKWLAPGEETAFHVDVNLFDHE